MNNNQNKVSNTKKETPKGMALNEKDYITELLTCLKCMEKNYVVALTEASNEVLYNKYKPILGTIADLKRETYELMFRNGWYSLEKVEDTKLQEKYQMLNQELQDLNS